MNGKFCQFLTRSLILRRSLLKDRTRSGCSNYDQLGIQEVCLLLALALVGKDIVFRFIIEYSSLMDFGPWVISLFL
jgi:hypothetical protein